MLSSTEGFTPNPSSNSFIVSNESALKKLLSSTSISSFNHQSFTPSYLNTNPPKPLSKTSTHQTARTIGPPKQSIRPPTRAEMMTDRAAAKRWEKHQQTLLEQQQNILLRQERIEAEKERRFADLLYQISQEETSFVSAIQDFIEAHHSIKQQRKKELWEHWNSEVFGRIMAEIDKVVENQADDVINQKRRLFDLFLKMVEKKGSMSLDDISAEYDALAYTRLKARIPKLEDPLKSCLTGDDNSKRSHPDLKTKQMIPVESWSTPPIINTLKPPSKANVSSIVFDDFNN
ncbi:hypothetical protein P9112_012022 [Eukaryota sp. TZLM1-RC]